MTPPPAPFVEPVARHRIGLAAAPAARLRTVLPAAPVARHRIGFAAAPAAGIARRLAETARGTGR